MNKPVNCRCGGKAVVEKYRLYEEQIEDMFIVRCAKCDIQTSPEYKKEKAIETWNKAMGADVNSVVSVFSSEVKDNFHPVYDCMIGKERTAKVKVVEKPNVFKCSECGQYFHSTAWGSPVKYCSRCGAKLDWNEDIPMEYFESGGK